MPEGTNEPSVTPAVTPPAAPGGQPPANPPAGAATSQTTQPTSGDETMSLEEAKKLRAEANTLRKRLKDLDDAKAAEDLAKLGDLEKATKQLSDLQTQHADFQRAAQERIVRYEVKLAAQELKFHNPDAAARLLDWSQLEFDDDGIPTNAGKLLKKLSETDPYLVAAANGAQPGRPNVPPTNQGRNNQPPGQPGGTTQVDPKKTARFGTPGQQLFQK